MPKKRDYKAEYKKRPYYSRLSGWYKSNDKKNGRHNNLSAKQVKILIELPCYYCGKTPSNGLDRKDNNLGHIIDNVLPSCHKCNMLLGTTTLAIKKELAPALKKIREKGLFENWEPPKGKPFGS